MKTLKLPVGKSGFFNEIHPKLRPVETVVDGVYICGTCQAPRNSAESVASGLAAVTQSASILKQGFAELDPLVAMVDADACTWCGECQDACPYDAISRERSTTARTSPSSPRTACKGCGGCVPVCPVESHRPGGLHRRADPGHDRRHDGGELLMTAPARNPAVRLTTAGNRHIREIIRDEQFMRARILNVLEDGPVDRTRDAQAIGRPTYEVVFWVMGMRKYGWVTEMKEADEEGYFRYQAVPRDES